MPPSPYAHHLKCYCPSCGNSLVRLFWHENANGQGCWMGTCLNPRCSCCATTVSAADKSEPALEVAAPTSALREL